MRKTVILTAIATCAIAIPAQAENLEHTRQLLATKQCQNCDLTGVGLVFSRLPGANLTGANLAGANLSQANLVGADLTGANLAGANLAGANLAGARLTRTNLAGASVRGANLSGVELTGASYDLAEILTAQGVPNTIGTAEDFYRMGLEAARAKNLEKAIEHFSQTLTRKPDFASAYAARGMARFNMADTAGSIADLTQAETLFRTQGNIAEADSTKKAIEVAKTPVKDPKQRGGNGIGIAALSIFSSLLKFVIPSFF
jgi:uncharacterized protein YjbI with pentapeptide repeats